MKEQLAKIVNPEDFSWIKVKKYEDDVTKSDLERLEALKEHHIKETTFLLNKCRELALALLDS